MSNLTTESAPPWDSLPEEQQIVASWRGDAGCPLVSVLCHTYNQAEYLPAALAGILRQRTDFPFEVIVRDDASTDGTSELVKSYAERFPQIIRAVLEPENSYRLGVKPIAATVPLARSEFIAFCEGDDYWLGRDKLQGQVGFMREHPECGLVHANYLNLIRMGGAWRTRVALRNRVHLQYRSGAIYAAMLGANRIQTCTVLCRRRLVEDYRCGGPGVDGYMVGDWPLFLYLAHESNIGFFERPLAAYRKTPGSLMNSGHQAAVERGLDAIRMVEDFCDFFRDHADACESAFAVQYRVLLWLAFRAGDVQRFEQAWTWLAEHRPELLSYTRARAMRATIGTPSFRRATLGALSAIESIKHRIEFRKVDAEPVQ